MHEAASIKPLPPSFQGNFLKWCLFWRHCREPITLTSKQHRQVDLMWWPKGKGRGTRIVLKCAQTTCSGKLYWAGLKQLLPAALCPNPWHESVPWEPKPCTCTLKHACNHIQFQFKLIFWCINWRRSGGIYPPDNYPCCRGVSLQARKQSGQMGILTLNHSCAKYKPYKYGGGHTHTQQ